MRKHYLYIITLSASLLAFTGCSNETDFALSNIGKSEVELSVGGETGSRAVITDGTGKTLNAFTANTDIWMVMQSEYKALSGNLGALDDEDFKGEQATVNCVTMGTATVPAISPAGKENNVTFEAANKRYWDDAHARSSALSIWAIAVPNVTGAPSEWGSKTTSSWNTTIEDKTIAWSVPATQDATSVKEKDLCFSNNIVGGDNRLTFKKENPNRGFEHGQLIFYHALTKITINLVEGDGFDHTITTDFNLDNISLKGFKLGGTFDVAQGEFTAVDAETTKITSMSQVEKTAAGITLEALVMPGTDLEGVLPDAVSFSLDGSGFNVSAATMKEKLIAGGASSFNKFEAGKNYIFTFTINQTGIEVTATIANWENVTAANETPLINVTTAYGQEHTAENDFGKGFSFLRSLSLASGYKKDADVTCSGSPNVYTMTPQLYWPNHSTHYFFRGVWPLMDTGSGLASSVTPDSEVSASDIKVANCAYTQKTYPSDLMLGYPRTTTEACPHGNTVATSGICATEGEIRMNFQYVMSQVIVNLQTSTGTDAVTFDENTKVEIIGGYKEGAIKLSDGTADFTGKTTAAYDMNKVAPSNDNFHDAIIPQSLEDLKFRITVTDPASSTQDTYETVYGIKEIEVIPDGGVKGKIDTWEPGKKYIYNLYITKTGIKVTATLTDWITVTADENVWF
ncbi:MAG: fimbrillin family protein [Prevotella sp.]|nr:fimbrillin family protein [Candidatus Prevotella equi]